LGTDSLVVGSGNGAGQWLSAAPVALAAAFWFGLRLVRDVNQGARQAPARLRTSAG
jgi:hypothetical protein